MKNNYSYLIVFLILVCFKANAQSISNDHLITTLFNTKVSELISPFTASGFIKYKGDNLAMERRTEFPIMIQLIKGRWYQFIFVGDPESTKIEIKLGMEGYGDFITDKFRPQNTDEYWTQFSFICPRSGTYLLTLFQKGNKKNMLGNMTILQKPYNTEDSVISFTH